MKKIYFFLIISILGLKPFITKSQNNNEISDDYGRIILNTYISDNIEGLQSSAKRMLKNKMSQITSLNGIGGQAINPRFIITPNITILTKDLTSSAPPMTALTLEITLYIGDGIEGTVFSSTSKTVKGVGTNKTKAYLSGIKRINPRNPIFKDFVEDGKNKIIKYYNSKCDFIIKEAKTLESQNKFEEAIAKLMAVPKVCKECYEKSMDAVDPIFQKYIDRQCKIALNKAKNAWNAHQNSIGAEKVSKYLAEIDPEASCYNDAISLSNKIAKRIKELDRRDWDFKMKQQQDEIDLQQSRIRAARDVGVAYGRNQPKTVYKIKGWW